MVESGNTISFDCISNSSQLDVGQVLGLDGIAVPSTGDFSATRDPSTLRFEGLDFTAEDQGIYTCVIPDDNGNDISINVGLYNTGFNGMAVY